MTAIVAHRDGWIVADTQSTFHGCMVGPFEVHKIVNFGHTLIGASGLSAFKQQITKPLANKTEDKLPAALQKYLEEKSPDVYVLLVNSKGRLSKFDSAGCEYPVKPSFDFWAIGSGADHTLGWLACIQQQRKVTPQDAVKAIEYAAACVTTVNSTCDIEFVKKRKK